MTNLKTINEAIADQIAGSSTVVREIVIRTMVDAEVNRRTNMLVEAIQKAEQQRRELRKFKPDQISYTENGEVASATWSKEVLEDKKKATEKLEKLERAIEKALTAGEFNDLSNLK